MIEIKETLWVLQNIEYDDGGRGNGASLVMMKKGILTYINPSLHTRPPPPEQKIFYCKNIWAPWCVYNRNTCLFKLVDFDISSPISLK